ncbi:sensor histidine kinase [Lewinella sp. W8]|uniref:sensor histidine kinase n=1 Tax=Lewinella sp. W8 TaxID=2528208 RepID=UPI001067CCF9|nr:sensor histidine kinase [Lewinella sp. W8]MTB50078.1 histidine kinase [Lewinella sp. W8]
MSSLAAVSIFLGYLLILFGVAYIAEGRRGWLGRMFHNPFGYALSLTVYCTAWTFFGSVGRAANDGLSFLPIYLGPLMLAPVWPFLMEKIIRIAKSERITSIPDFISSRYGKSRTLGLLAATFLVIGTVPYISLQIKAIAAIFDLLTEGTTLTHAQPFYRDNALFLTLVLALFTVIFGVRRLDANERHQGVIAAISFEGVFKLLAFLFVGIFVVWVFFGRTDTPSFFEALTLPSLAGMSSISASGITGWDWFWLCLVSMAAVVLLPRQFHVSVVENNNIGDLKRAAWVFPLYLLLINLFVLPIAAAGYLHFGAEGLASADTFVISLPKSLGYPLVATIAALGGFAAATGMVIMSTISLSLMISNNIVLPFLLEFDRKANRNDSDLSKPLLNIRRLIILLVLLLAYGYYQSVGNRYSLVAIGLISFTAVAQFAPSVLAGLYWKAATKRGALIGLVAGFILWSYTLALPTTGGMLGFGPEMMANGPWGLSWLRPHQLLGAGGMTPIAHGAFWSLLVNCAGLAIFSLNDQPDAMEIRQADFFVDHDKYRRNNQEYQTRRRRAKVSDLEQLLSRFTGAKGARKFVRNALGAGRYDRLRRGGLASPELLLKVEQKLSGAIGTASAQVLMRGITKEDPIKLEEVIAILRKTQDAVQYGKELEVKQSELEAVTTQLRAANQQLRELDELKAEFISTVTHELRTPITSVKSLARILLDHHDMEAEQRATFLKIIVSESERLTRLVSQVLDIEKIEQQRWTDEGHVLDFNQLVRDAISSLRALLREHDIFLEKELPETPLYVTGPADRLTQVIVNLLGNAIKFVPDEDGQIRVSLRKDPATSMAELRIQDNGPGIPPEKHELIFERFTQISSSTQGKPSGSGLGLHISKTIIERCGGSIGVEAGYREGAGFLIRLPISPAPALRRPDNISPSETTPKAPPPPTST